jgi:dihydrofolate reductase
VLLDHCFDLPAVVGINAPPECLHVLLRHRPRSISPRNAAFHAKQRFRASRARFLRATGGVRSVVLNHAMRPLRYSINVTLDGCCDHRAISAEEETHRHATENLEQADALLFGRVTYEMMESAWRPPGQTEAMPDWMASFGRTIDAAKKYVVSSTLDRVDWNAEIVRGDLGQAVQELKGQSGKGLLVGGVKLPLALAELGLIDEYEFVVQPRLVGHGPTLFAGLSKRLDLRLVGRLEFASGAVAMRYEPTTH